MTLLPPSVPRPRFCSLMIIFTREFCGNWDIFFFPQTKILCCSQMCWSKAVVGSWEQSPAPTEHCLWLIIYVTLMHSNKAVGPSAGNNHLLWSNSTYRLSQPHRCLDTFFPIPPFLAEISWAAHNAKSLPAAHDLARSADIYPDAMALSSSPGQCSETGRFLVWLLLLMLSRNSPCHAWMFLPFRLSSLCPPE